MPLSARFCLYVPVTTSIRVVFQFQFHVCRNRSGLCEQCHKTVDEIVEDADEKLFNNIIYNKLHVLNHILPDTKDTKYHLRLSLIHI